jgi:hypothetical protein
MKVFLRVVLGVVIALVFSMQIGIGARLATAWAWPHGRLVAITEDVPDDFETGVVRLVVEFIYGVLSLIFAVAFSFSFRQRVLMLGCMFIVPVVIYALAGINCEIVDACIGNSSVLLWIVSAATAGVLSAAFVAIFYRRRG